MRIGYYSLLVVVCVRTVLAWAQQAPIKPTVSEYNGSMLTVPDVNSILHDGSAALLVDGNQQCGLTFIAVDRTNPIPDNLASVSDPDIDKLCGHSAGVHIYVVQQIHSCGREVNAILGCTPASQPCMVVVHDPGSPDKKTEEPLWMHEYGHVQTLKDRDDASPYLMNSVLVTDQIFVSPSECKALKVSNLSMVPDTHQTNTAARLSLDDFLTQKYIHGVPLETAKLYGPEAVPDLVGRLRAYPAEKQLCRNSLNSAAKEESLCTDRSTYWVNVVMVLGALGGEPEINELVGFFEAPPCNCAEPSYQARAAVPLALGYILARTNSDIALGILRRWSLPQNWRFPPFHMLSTDTLQQSALGLAKTSILALGASGNPDALKYLNELKQSQNNSIDHNLFDDLLDHSIKINQQNFTLDHR